MDQPNYNYVYIPQTKNTTYNCLRISGNQILHFETGCGVLILLYAKWTSHSAHIQNKSLSERSLSHIDIVFEFTRD